MVWAALQNCSRDITASSGSTAPGPLRLAPPAALRELGTAPLLR
jgi:hypothetical protein